MNDKHTVPTRLRLRTRLEACGRWCNPYLKIVAFYENATNPESILRPSNSLPIDEIIIIGNTNPDCPVTRSLASASGSPYCLWGSCRPYFRFPLDCLFQRPHGIELCLSYVASCCFVLVLTAESLLLRPYGGLRNSTPPRRCRLEMWSPLK